MPRSRASTLWLRLAAPFLLFVAAGSLGLALWLHAAARRESQTVFATLARTNADFIRNAHLPANERVAESIGRVLGMDVFFRQPAWEMTAGESGAMAMKKSRELIPRPTGILEEHADLIGTLSAANGIVQAGSDFEAIAVPVEKDVALILVRRVEPALWFLLKPQTLLLLTLFWLLSVALAWSFARGFVRPLRLLAERLPHIQSDADASLPGAERNDEIGEVARAYLDTRAQLADERTRRERAERLALLGRMATGLAHEIHNPLSAIRMHAQLIHSAPDGQTAVALRESLPVLLGETAKIESLVNQWMFLARPAPPQTAPADLGEIVAGVIRALAPQAAHACVEIDNEIPQGIRAKVDARRLAQAIGNITMNAIQAMPGGGTLTITGWRGESARLVFRDTGPGFSGKALAQHAELFFSEKEGGMGIGLSVTAEILKAHGGALLVGNSPGGGAVVTVQLPLLPTPSGARKSESIILPSEILT
jgi:signal transduction histidine kinase